MNDFAQIEEGIRGILVQVSGRLPQDQLSEMLSLVQAGEPGIALENLCTQLFEYDISVSVGLVDRISEFGKQMGIASKYWDRLSIEN